MEFSIESKPFGSMLKIWALFSILILVFTWAFLLLFKLISGKPEDSLLISTLSNPLLWIFPPLYALSIAFQGRQKVVKVTHKGIVNIEQLVALFENMKWHRVSQNDSKIEFRCSNKFERFALGKAKILVELAEDGEIFHVPSKFVYHIHHGYKFGKFLET